jgi:hypothetical protein
LATKRDADVRDYLVKFAAAASNVAALAAAFSALGEYGARPYWADAAGAAERTRIANALFAQVGRAATDAAAKDEFIKSMLRIDAPNCPELIARALGLGAAEKALAGEWEALARRVHSN